MRDYFITLLSSVVALVKLLRGNIITFKFDEEPNNSGYTTEFNSLVTVYLLSNTLHLLFIALILPISIIVIVTGPTFSVTQILFAFALLNIALLVLDLESHKYRMKRGIIVVMKTPSLMIEFAKLVKQPVKSTALDVILRPNVLIYTPENNS